MVFDCNACNGKHNICVCAGAAEFNYLDISSKLSGDWVVCVSQGKSSKSIN